MDPIKTETYTRFSSRDGAEVIYSSWGQGSKDNEMNWTRIPQ